MQCGECIFAEEMVCGALCFVVWDSMINQIDAMGAELNKLKLEQRRSEDAVGSKTVELRKIQVISNAHDY